jgi:hypothetical protein
LNAIWRSFLNSKIGWRVARQGIEFQHMHGQSEGAPAAISESPTKAALVGGSAGNGCNGSAHTPDNSQNPTPFNF